MKRAFTILLSVLLALCWNPPALADGDEVNIICPRNDAEVGPRELEFTASAASAEKVVFLLDGEMLAEFEGGGTHSYILESISYGVHTFEVHAITRGEELKKDKSVFSVILNEKNVLSEYNCNDFDGSNIATAEFAGFTGNSDPEGGGLQGKLEKGEGADGSACVKLIDLKQNRAQWYMPYLVFVLNKPSGYLYTVEYDICVGEIPVSIYYEYANNVFPLLIANKAGAKTLESGRWYHMEMRFDNESLRMKQFIDGEMITEQKIAAFSSGYVRLDYETVGGDGGYWLLDNFKCSENNISPLFDSVSYSEGGKTFTVNDKVPESADGFVLQFNSMPLSSVFDLKLIAEGEEQETEYSLIASEKRVDVTLKSALERNARYTVACTVDNSGIPLEYRFYTDNGPIGVKDTVYSNGKYNIEYSSQVLDGEPITTAVSLENKSDAETSLFIITVVYDENGALFCINASEAVAKSGGTEVNIPAVEVKQGHTLATYVLDSWKTRKLIQTAKILR